MINLNQVSILAVTGLFHLRFAECLDVQVQMHAHREEFIAS
jgi:hypothetical protein